MTTKEWREEAIAMITLLSERFPACFAVVEARRRPLKIGIHNDIIAAVGVAPDELGRALKRYTQADGYCAKLKAGAARIDLDGHAAGVVTEDEAKAAAASLAKRKARREARKRAAAAPPAPTKGAHVDRAAARGRAPARQCEPRSQCVIRHHSAVGPPSASAIGATGPARAAASRLRSSSSMAGSSTF